MLVLCPVLVGWLWLCVPIQASERASRVPRRGGWPAGRGVRRTGWPLAAHVIGFPHQDLFSPSPQCLFSQVPPSQFSFSNFWFSLHCLLPLSPVSSPKDASGCEQHWLLMACLINIMLGWVLKVQQSPGEKCWQLSRKQQYECSALSRNGRWITKRKKRGTDRCRKGKRLWVKTADTVKGIFCVFLFSLGFTGSVRHWNYFSLNAFSAFLASALLYNFWQHNWHGMLYARLWGWRGISTSAIFCFPNGSWCELLNSFLQQLCRDACHPLRLERGNAEKP